MATFVLTCVLAFLSFSTADAAECEKGWTAYKDETCIKSFPDFVTYDEALELCASQSNSVSSASLVAVKESGAKYDRQSAQFKWEDGQRVTYANWNVGYPRNNTDSEMCIQLKPVSAKTKSNLSGKWEDAACERRNLALCQRPLSWTLKDAIGEILAIREELKDTKVSLETTNQQLVATKQDLEVTKRHLATVNSTVFPVGSIYVEYYNQPAPNRLWPTFQWQEVTSTYAGLFFRAFGGTSASWGTRQTECAPHITQLQYDEGKSDGSHTLNLPENGWSEFGKTGYNHYTGGHPGNNERVKYHIQGCEVRPKNQAVRIWKRTA